MGVNTWANITVNLSIGLITTLLLLIVYEVARRIPSFSKALFDHERSIRPHRTPPPLMRSRCKPSSTTQWPALLEFLFLSLSKEYIEYSSVINEEEKKISEMKEKEKSSESLVAHETESVVESRSLLVKEDLEPHLTTSESITRQGASLLQSANTINHDEQDATVDEVTCYSPHAELEDIYYSSCPSRCKYFCLPVDFTGSNSVFHFIRMLMEKDNRRHESVHLGSLILETQRLNTLSYEDAELLRCIGLDSFIMIRFLRFCFEVCILFFIIACLVLLPTYYSSKYTGESAISDQPNANNLTVVTYGYYRVTIDRVEPGSSRLVVRGG